MIAPFILNRLKYIAPALLIIMLISICAVQSKSLKSKEAEIIALKLELNHNKANMNKLLSQIAIFEAISARQLTDRAKIKDILKPTLVDKESPQDFNTESTPILEVDLKREIIVDKSVAGACGGKTPPYFTPVREIINDETSEAIIDFINERIHSLQ